MAFLKKAHVRAVLEAYSQIRDDELPSRELCIITLCFLVTGVLIEPHTFTLSSTHLEQYDGLFTQVFVALRELGAAASRNIAGGNGDDPLCTTTLCNQDSCLPPCGKVWMFSDDWKTYYAQLRHTYRRTYEVGVDENSFYYAYRILMHYTAPENSDYQKAIQYLYDFGFLKHKVAVNLKIGAINILQNNYNINYATKYIENVIKTYACTLEMTLIDADVAIEDALAETLFSRDSLTNPDFTVTGTIPALDTFKTVNNKHWCVTSAYDVPQLYYCAPGMKPLLMDTAERDCLNNGTPISGESSLHRTLTRARAIFEDPSLARRS